MLCFIFYNMRRTLSKKQLSLHKEAGTEDPLLSIQNVQLTADNILDKLLHPTAIDKKLPENTKYKPKFEKRDYETLVHQNLNLKQQLNEEKQTVSQLRFRLGEMERKVKFLQGIQEKWEESVQQRFDGKKLQVYTQILKKKIQELNELYLNSEQKIKELKKLPHVSVFDEQTVQMQQLKRQTIRLKAIIASMVDQQCQQDNIQNKFVKLMREENEKLKSTIRLLENDKNLLKSRQTIQKRQIADYRKEIDDLKKKLVIREAQIQKIQNETKNILLKKAYQLKSDQEKRQNQEIQKLKSKICDLNMQIERLTNEKEQLTISYQKLKKNQKLIESKQNHQDKEKNQLRTENSRLRRAIQELKCDLDRQKQNIKLLEQHHKKKRVEITKPLKAQKIQQLVPVKFEELQLPLLHIIYALQYGFLNSISSLFQAEELTCGRVIEQICQEPIGMERSQAIKLVRYLTENSNQHKVEFSQKRQMDRSLSSTILKASISKLLECRNSQNQDRWRCLLAKARKLVPQLQKLKDQLISKEQFLAVLSRHLNQNFGSWVQLIILESFQPTSSQLQIMLEINKILEVLNKLLMNQPLH